MNEAINNDFCESKVRKTMSKLNVFFYSNLYFLLLLIISFACWYANETIVGLYLLLSLGILCLITNRDIAPVLPMMPLMLMTVSKSDFLRIQSNIMTIGIVVTIFLIAFIFNIIYHKQKLRTGRVFIPFILVSIALFMGGLGSPYLETYKDGLLWAFCLGPMMLAIYLACMSMIHIPKNVDTKMYFCKIVTVIASLAALEVLVSHIRMGGELIDHFRAILDVGWGNRASLVIMLMLGLSSAFYFADNSKHFNFVLYHFAFALYLALMFTCGRGGMIFGSIEMLAITIYLFIKGKHKTQFGITLGMWALGIIVSIAVEYEVFIDILDKFRDLGFQSSGRDSLYYEAWDLMFKYPIFGVGLGFHGKHYFDPAMIYLFHNTVFQICASMGLIGVIAYGSYYIQRLRVLFERINPYNIMIIFALFAFEAQSLIDSGNFQPLPFLYTAILLNTFVEYSNREEYEDELYKHLDELADRINAKKNNIKIEDAEE